MFNESLNVCAVQLADTRRCLNRSVVGQDVPYHILDNISSIIKAILITL